MSRIGRAPVFFDERGNIGGYAAKYFHPFFRLDIEERPDVKLTRSGMPVINAGDAIFFPERPVELRDIRRQIAHGTDVAQAGKAFVT